MKVTARRRPVIKVADEVWIATALLHREHPERDDFTIDEIVDRVRRVALTPELRPGVRVHALLHCVANRPPNPARYRMLFATGKGSRRLYRPGDPAHPARTGKMEPAKEEVPAGYRELLGWYHTRYARRPPGVERPDPLLALRGSGKALWADEHADDYVRRLREGWP